MLPVSGSWYSQKTFAGPDSWISNACNFILIPGAFLAFHWFLFFTFLGQSDWVLTVEVFPFSFFSIPKADGKQSNLVSHVFEMLDVNSSGGILLRVLIWGLLSCFWSLRLNWLDLYVIAKLSCGSASLNWRVTRTFFQIESIRDKVILLEYVKVVGHICGNSSELTVFLFIFSFSLPLPHLLKPRLSFWGFLDFLL